MRMATASPTRSRSMAMAGNRFRRPTTGGTSPNARADTMPKGRCRLADELMALANDVEMPAREGLRERLRSARSRYSPLDIAKGLWVSRHVRWRSFVAWTGGMPAPKAINRGGQFATPGCNLFEGVRLEIGPGARLTIGKG